MKIKTKLIISIATATSIITGLLSVPAYASYVYGVEYNDNITSTTKDYYDLPQHNYIGNDIGASYIYVTAPRNVKYYLSLYQRNFIWSHRLSDTDFICQTAGLGGSFYWNSISSNEGNTPAYISITRVDRSNTTTLGGYIKSKTRTWR